MIKITTAKPNESQQIRRFEQLVWHETCITSPYDIVTFVTYGYVFLAKENNKIVGAIIAIKTKKDEIRIIDWLVEKNHRHRGIGTKLYHKLRRAVGGLAIIAYVESRNTASLAGHKKLGFKRIKKVADPFYLSENTTWWVMKKLNTN